MTAYPDLMTEAGGPDFASLVAQMWVQFKPIAEERFGVLEHWATTGEGRLEAEDAAHKLAGSLGSYGRPAGSHAARRLEQLAAQALPHYDDAVRDALQLLEEAMR